jgi:hypothetical protein
MPILEGWTSRNRRFERLSNCPSRSLTSTSRLVSSRLVVYFSMVLQVRQRPSLRVRWELTRLRVGTGKTMLVKAVANNTSAAFIRVVGSEFVQKYLGEGPRMVRDVFRLARENAPAIIFIDEIDAIATKRFDAQTGADREVQRILLELLNQMDGFDQGSNVKVIMATNRADTLVSLSLLS